MQLKRVVITGLGALTPLGNDLNTYWENLVQGKSGAGPITRFDASKFRTRFACELKGYDPNAHFNRKEARKMDPYCQYAMVAADEAIKNSGLVSDSLDFNRVGVIWASGIGGIRVFEEEISNYALGDGTPKFNPFFIPKMIVDMGAGQISMKHGFRGVNFATVSACSSATHAMIDAFNYIRLGKANAIVTGGSEAAVSFAGVGGFGGMKALSENNDAPQNASRPFDKDRDGFVLGEGAGALILEELEHALNRGANIYAEVVGGGASADAYHLTATHPEGLGARLAMQAALDDAKLSLTDVDYLNAHATSTPVGDVSETKAISLFFGDHAPKMNISATKSMTGHLLGAAGAIEGIASVMAIKHGIIPPTINLDNRDERIPEELNLTANVAAKRDITVAMSNTFGFGGHNAIAVFKKFEE